MTLTKFTALLAQLTKENVIPGSQKFSRLKTVLLKIFSMPADIMNEVIDANIEDDRQFVEDVQEIVDSWKHAGRQQKRHEDPER